MVRAVEANAVPFTLVLADGRRAWAEVEEDRARVVVEGGGAVSLARPERGVFTALDGFEAGLPPEALLPLLAHVFARRPKVEAAQITLPASEDWAREAIRAGVVQSVAPGEGGRQFTATRSAFWQHPDLWLKGRPSGQTPLAYVMTGEKRHPQRPPKPVGEVYRRHMPRFKAEFSLRTVDIEADLETFNRWMNLDSVAEFWNERGTLDQHRSYLTTIAADPHTISFFGCFDDAPFAYFEMYWAKEDRVAPFYDADDYDRGLHLLVGDPRHQGPGKVEAWFRALSHYMFLDDPRTRRLIGDPRIDHVRWIEYMQKQGFVRLKAFDLPHKRSELIFIERETFFGPPHSGPA
ncbi:GNAT family N-acetyltransferase [Methylobacterium sp. Leaf118]|uniref:GNAT family N-acetyltransferase n=1 Tax=Methylobacterium sp. Leaf118 TaxID=2876562 RepID=UPI001E2B427A|nr:GNAT family N-acetyltransferase [Methylobacterium sp. Leaf118]